MGTACGTAGNTAASGDDTQVTRDETFGQGAYVLQEAPAAQQSQRSVRDVDVYFGAHYTHYAGHQHHLRYGLLSTPNTRNPDGTLALDHRPVWAVSIDNVTMSPSGGPGGPEPADVNERVTFFLADGDLAFVSELDEPQPPTTRR